jgi:fluoroquinolone transport system ATP-binding protein
MIEVKDLTFSYPDRSSSRTADSPPTLNDLSFTVAAGEIFGFLGPSGAGKSTTQRILYRLLGGYTGEVRIAQRNLREWDTSLYAMMGIGFETPNLYTRLTGRENLLFASALRGGDSRSLTADLDEAARRLGLEEAIDTRVETWSKGMRMRLAFIRAVIHRPELVFLDEPTSGLDPFWARCVKDWILELRAGGAAVFVTTHSMELADELCDNVGFLVEGRLVAIDAPAALKQRYGRTGVTVQGLNAQGAPLERDLEYQVLLDGPVPGFSRIDRVVNREVNLEQVFLAVTGHSLGGTP